jgi:hypothetical protein
MTTFDNPKKVKNNPEFLPVAVTMDQVVEKHDEHDMSNMWRELPLWTVQEASPSRTTGRNWKLLARHFKT